MLILRVNSSTVLMLVAVLVVSAEEEEEEVDEVDDDGGGCVQRNLLHSKGTGIHDFRVCTGARATVRGSATNGLEEDAECVRLGCFII